MKYEDFQKLALSFPGVEEAIAYGTPIFKVKGKMMARLTDEADIVVIKTDPALRSTLVGATEAFFVTPHYEPYPLMLIDLKKATPDDLEYLLEQAWRAVATKKMIVAFDSL